MKFSHDSKIVLWFICCALAGAFLQSMIDPFDLARRTKSTRTARSVRVQRARGRRVGREVVYQ